MGSVLAVFDLDGTLADDRARVRWVYDYGDQTNVLQDAPIVPVMQTAKGLCRREDTFCVYMTGRSQSLFETTRLWLLGNGLIGRLLCRPDWTRDGDDITRWKVREIVTLASKWCPIKRVPQYERVTVFENKAQTLQELKRRWPKTHPELTCLFVTENFEIKQANSIRQGCGRELTNFKLIMTRMAEPGWEVLLRREWKTRGDLLSAAVGYIPGRRKRREFIQIMDSLWRPKKTGVFLKRKE